MQSIAKWYLLYRFSNNQKRTMAEWGNRQPWREGYKAGICAAKVLLNSRYYRAKADGFDLKTAVASLQWIATNLQVQVSEFDWTIANQIWNLKVEGTQPSSEDEPPIPWKDHWWLQHDLDKLYDNNPYCWGTHRSDGYDDAILAAKSIVHQVCEEENDSRFLTVLATLEWMNECWREGRMFFQLQDIGSAISAETVANIIKKEVCNE